VSDVANKISEECEKDLAAALPILENAKEAVNCLNKSSIGVFKSFNKPPGNCVYVTNAVMLMLGIEGAKK
jgi:dynein heavy chain